MRSGERGEGEPQPLGETGEDDRTREDKIVSFLTPLYIAGILAVSLPIIFHLIRRTPRDRVQFSSLMFLQESPPRVSRRSRLENLTLLALRATALSLLALAFARPFLRQPLQADVGSIEGRLIAILVDTSASMRRADLAQQAIDRVENVLKETTPADQIALYAFDREVREVVGFDQWGAVPIAGRQAWLMDEVKQLAPTWANTNLGSTLANVADALDARAARQSVGRTPEQLIVLVSDLARGADSSALGQYDWPENVRVKVEIVKPRATTNATIQLAADREESSEHGPADRPNVRVHNADDSDRGQFRVRWAASNSPSVEVHVPPGRSRVIQAPTPPLASVPTQLIVEGDDHDFDNSLYVTLIDSQTVDVLFIGNGTADDPKSPRYYFDRAFADSLARTVRVLARSQNEAVLSADLASVRLAVLTDSASEDTDSFLRNYVNEGGTVLAVLTSVASAESIGRLLKLDEWAPAEAVVNDYVMLGEITFAHSLLAPFSDPQYRDFTKIHFWKYRRIDVTRLAGAQVLARFDTRDPALVELPVGRGTLLLLASGWHPEDSQLALSSKFVPLLTAILDRACGREFTALDYHVGDSVTLPESAQPPIRIQRPDGSVVVVPQESGRRFTDTVMPGVYSLVSASTPVRFAVNLSPSESNTAPLPVEELERMGVRLTAGRDLRKIEAGAARQRQMHSIELESRQKLWRWIIVAVIAILAAETWLAGRLSRVASAK